MPANPFWQDWAFHVPNYLLALAMYLMVGRLLLSFLVHPGSGNYIWRSFVRLTEPVLAVVRLVTPAAAAAVPPVLMVFAILWLFAARIVLFMALTATGVGPTIG
jgi:uncharacterized protein YggT (Ycf19 family)